MDNVKIELREVEDFDGIENLFPIIKKIWETTFIPIIGKEQVAYMLLVYQSKEEIYRQIKEDNLMYFSIFYMDEIIGYIAYRKEAKRLFISKIYLLSEYQGKGIATELFNRIEKIAGKAGLNSLYLHVNQENKKAIQIYEHRGFENIGEIVTDINKGFLMEDFIFEKKLY